MKTLSVLIPSYDMASHLELTLRSIAAASARCDDVLEVVVLDDGSTDDTRRVAEAFAHAIPRLRYRYRPRDELSSRATIRNFGAADAVGELLLFIDSGVLLPRALFSAYALHFEANDKLVLSYPVLGLLLDGEHDTASLRSAATDVDALISRLAKDSKWRDPRQPLFELHAGRLHELSAPWAFCWTCALLLPRRLYVEAGGFDQAFLGWGSEDIDLGKRLQARGATFRADSSTAVVHVPHAPRSSKAERAASNQRNRALLHDKSPDTSSELMTVLSAIHTNFLHQRLETLPLDYLYPVDHAALAEWRQSNVSTRVAALGWTDPEALRLLRPSLVFAHNQCAERVFAALLPQTPSIASLGLRTGLEVGAIDVVVVSDFVRTLPAAVRRAQLVELARVAGNVVLFLTPDRRVLDAQRSWHQSENCAELWPWVSPAELLSQLESLGWSLQQVAGSTDTLVVHAQASGVAMRAQRSAPEGELMAAASARAEAGS